MIREVDHIQEIMSQPVVLPTASPSSESEWQLEYPASGVARQNARISDLEELVDSLVRVMTGRGRDMEVMNERITELEAYIAELENS